MSSSPSACLQSLRAYPDVDQGCFHTFALSGLARAAEQGTDRDQMLTLCLFLQMGHLLGLSEVKV